MPWSWDVLPSATGPCFSIRQEFFRDFFNEDKKMFLWDTSRLLISTGSTSGISKYHAVSGNTLWCWQKCLKLTKSLPRSTLWYFRGNTAKYLEVQYWAKKNDSNYGLWWKMTALQTRKQVERLVNVTKICLVPLFFYNACQFLASLFCRFPSYSA